ncbi:MAG TPA: helix-turn-helix domain-containing protein, partial [Candidatus Faecousia excrementigallinarum]|nr:helix-turn-helix domain-containing protein [Candidatus Faecousia excrementigallinarum]
MSYTHFTLKEREYLQKLFLENKSIREIALTLGRSPSS